VFALLLALFGSQQGFVVGALSLAGFVGGAILGARLAPILLSEGSESPYAPIFSLGCGLLVGAIMAAGLEGVAQALRNAIAHVPGFAAVDGGLGAVLSGAVALAVAWVAGAVALGVPGQPELRREVQRSAVLRTLNEVLPPSGPILNVLARLDPLPALRGPSADVAPPRAAIARDPEVRAAGASVVRILGTACGLGVAGSGWVAGDELVVTNAHVVAGQDDTTIQVGGEGPRLEATPVAFDVTNDVAVLRVDGLEAPALRLAGSARPGTSAAILGFPRNGAYDVRAARLGRTLTAVSSDAYGRGPVSRSLTTFRGNVRSGNSGGPLVDGNGRVAATVFAAAVGGRRKGGYGVPNAIVARRLRASAEPVGTGACSR